MKNCIWKKGEECSERNGSFLNIEVKRTWCVKVLLLCMLVVCGSSLVAQQEKELYRPVNGHLSLRNMHMWRGFVVTPGVMTATAMEYNNRNGKLTLGLWGGASFDGSYKEFSYYGVYRFFDNFYVEVVSHNNYSNQEESEIDMFSYDKDVSPNFVDIALGYTISDELPLKIFWATILGGQDKDYEVEEDGKKVNSYSNYLEVTYKVYDKDGYQLSAFAGGAFSFSTEKTYYSESANFVNVGLTLNKRVEVFNREIPVNFSGIWNPESGKGVLQIDVVLF